jgi:hypothetical protein
MDKEEIEARRAEANRIRESKAAKRAAKGRKKRDPGR